jgi:hypothetical protein
MSTFYVKKDGSGTHTQIQSAIYDAISGDTINIGAGTWYENVEFIGKTLTLQGAGKDLTIIEGKSASDVVTGASFFSGEDVITVPSTAALIRGKSVSGVGITAGTRVSEIISATKFRISPAATVAADPTVISKTVINVGYGNSSLTVPNVTGLVVGMKVEGTGVNSYITAINSVSKSITLDAPNTADGLNVAISFKLAANVTAGSTTITLPSVTGIVVGQKIVGVGVESVVSTISAPTKTITLATPVSATGTKVVFSFKVARNNISITQATNVSSAPATIAFTQNSNGMVIRDLTAVGFDGSVGQEGAALGFGNSTGSGYVNFLIENCRFTANGDSAVMSGSATLSDNGVIQNCVFDGKTFVGSEPADVPGFSSFTANATIISIGAQSVIQVQSTRGIVVGGSMTSSAWANQGQVQSVSGNNVTINKLISGTVGQTISFTIANIAYSVPNVARNFVYIGTNTTPQNNNFKNLTFKNNLIKGQSGAVISATGNKSMFNSAVTIESFGGLVENNVIDGIFGAGDPNTVFANFAIRCRQEGIVVRNNVNKVSGGRGNSGFYVPLGTSENNVTLNEALVSATQPIAGQSVLVEMTKDMVKALPKVAADAQFSNESNWELVTFIYKKQGSSKRLVASFRDFESQKAMKLRSGMMTGDVFELHKVIISKPDRSLLVVKRSEIEGVTSFDFTLA